MAVAGQPVPESMSVARQAIQALGRGYDVVSDLRLSYCKGEPHSPLIILDNSQTQDIIIPGGVTVRNVPKIIKCDKGERTRFRSDILPFNQMSEQFNQGLSISGKIPLGLFNSMFGFSGSWQRDALSTKNLAMDGWFVTLYSVELPRSQLHLQEEVMKEVPTTWDPAALASFIDKYGTHITVGVKVGGKDVIYLKQHESSNLSPVEIQKILKRKADEVFAGVEGRSSLDSKERTDTDRVIEQQQAWINQGSRGPLTTYLKKEDITILHHRRGGNDHIDGQSHNKWLQSLPHVPALISMSFVPITSLLSGVPGCGFLSHAVNLYLRYKPQIEELHHFLEFQLPRQWAPVFGDLPLGPSRKERSTLAVQFSLMGPKLYVNTSSVNVGKKPVTGVRLYLEGKKNNRLAIHLQHLSTLPRILQPLWEQHALAEELKWQGPENFDPRFFEPVLWRSFSHVCTAPVENSETWIGDPAGAYVVIGAQLRVLEAFMKNVLYLKLLYSRIPEATIRRSEWDHSPATMQKTGIFSSFMSTTFSSTPPRPKQSPVVINSGVFAGGPPVPVQVPKLLKFVDTTEMTKGPQDAPGHWLVTGAKLYVDNGKISLRVKYSLLIYESTSI